MATRIKETSRSIAALACWWNVNELCRHRRHLPIELLFKARGEMISWLYHYCMTIEHHSSVNINADVAELVAEALAVHYACNRASRTSRLQRNLFLAFVGCIVFVLCMVLIPGLRQQLLTWPMLMYVFLITMGGVIGWVACLFFMADLEKATASRQKPRELKYVFRENEIEVIGENEKTTLSWAAINEAICGDKYWLLTLKANEEICLVLDKAKLTVDLQNYIATKVTTFENNFI